MTTKIISEGLGLGLHMYGGDVSDGGGVIFETFCPTQHYNLADHYIRF